MSNELNQPPAFCDNQCGQSLKSKKLFAFPFAGGLVYFCSKSCRGAFKISGKTSKPPGTGRNKKRGKYNRVEQSISKVIKDHLERTARFQSRLQAGGITTEKGYYLQLCTPGTPDRMFIDTLLIFIEIKKPGETPGEKQTKVAEQLKAAGVLCFAVESFRQYEEIRKYINRPAVKQRAAAAAKVIREIGQEIDKIIEV